MTDKRLKLSSQWFALDVVDHVPTITGAQCNGAIEVDIVIFVGVFEVLDGLL